MHADDTQVDQKDLCFGSYPHPKTHFALFVGSRSIFTGSSRYRYPQAQNYHLDVVLSNCAQGQVSKIVKFKQAR